ncbi:MAG: DUF72 domain-containing protein [Deltaproteobacteria bacterium]|nr:DUF72 domain-containing protein [Deltaproteobacteria bacterium]
MIRIGPAGWDYKDWEGVVYPPGLKGADRLAFLAELFDLVEVNVTFYRPVEARLTQRWVDAVSRFPEFRFPAKLLNVFTHERRLPEDLLRQFQDGLRPLQEAGRLGALLAQFPYSFHNTEENRVYLLDLKGEFPDFPLALEVRHRSWQSRTMEEFLRLTGYDFCNIDQPLVSYPMGRTAWVTGPRAYLRAHGRRKETWFEFKDDRQARYDYLYPPEELAELADRARSLADRAPEVYVVFNNHPAGQAVANALELSHLLAGRTFTLPHVLLAAFPDLQALTTRSEPPPA